MKIERKISWQRLVAGGIAAMLVLPGVTAVAADAPVGADLISISREEIEASGAQTVQQLLKSVPAVAGFGNAAQGGYGSADGSGTFAPGIHGIGASVSNGTLILVDGHRLPLSGINHSLADPNTIAPLAIERVEVLPEGASATYGADAVAGVINLITRHDFQGVEAAAQAGYASHYHTYSAGLLWGTKFDATAVMVSYNFEFRSSLLAGNRSFARANHTLLDPEAGVDGGGAGDFANNNCSPATVTTTAGNFAYPYTGSPFTTRVCDYTGFADLLPEDQRHNLLIKVTRDATDRLHLHGDFGWSREDNTANITRGAITGVRTWGTGSTAAGPGQINPFFTAPAGVNTATVSWQAEDLLGPGATNKGVTDTLFATLGAEYRLGDHWLLNLGSTIGQNDSSLRRDGALCTSCAILALNGTTQTGGSQSTPSVPGTTVAVLQSLTAANALDVWSPAATNRTSASVLAQLVDSTQLQQAHQTLQDFTASIDGTLLQIPGGSLRSVFGAEYGRYTMTQEQITPRGTGTSSGNSNSYFGDSGRNVQSVYAEFLIPVVGAANGRRGLRKLDLDVSARYDRYSDFGSTTNPKFAFSWALSSGFTVRGNVGRSFSAPALSSRGDANGITADSSFSTLNSGSATTGSATVAASFPGIAQLQARNLPGCTTGATTCILGNNAVTGIQLAGSNKDLNFATARTFSAGIDFAPNFAPDLRFSATFWDVRYDGAVTTPQLPFIVASPTLAAQAVTIYPTGATAAQIAAATAGMQQTAALPARVYFIANLQQRNAFNLHGAGIDADVRYAFRTRLGEFSTRLSVSRKLTMDQQFGPDGVSFSVLNTVGVNATFPSNRLAGVVYLGWKRAAWNATLSANYEGFYRNWNTTSGAGNANWNVIRVAGLYPVGGGEPIESYTTLDLHMGYDFKAGLARGLTVTLVGTNIFDNRPPFFNVASGYDTLNASPIDRLLTVGVSRKW